jgi:hypothetical protein
MDVVVSVGKVELVVVGSVVGHKLGARRAQARQATKGRQLRPRLDERRFVARHGQSHHRHKHQALHRARGEQPLSAPFRYHEE